MLAEFDRNILATNIAYLVKERNMKMGDFESQVEVSTGYVSRISRESAIKPSAEFIVKAANILNISIDTLLFTDLSSLTSTEQYFKIFTDKLISDTKSDKLEWHVERKKSLNSLKSDSSGNCPGFPLFSGMINTTSHTSRYKESFYTNSAFFKSNAYDVDTVIDDDCFNVDIDRDTALYVMHFKKKSNETEEEQPSSVIELWFVQGPNATTFVGGTLTFPNLAECIKNVYQTIKEYMLSPHLPKDVKYIIDGYLGPNYFTTTITGNDEEKLSDNSDNSNIPF